MNTNLEKIEGKESEWETQIEWKPNVWNVCTEWKKERIGIGRMWNEMKWKTRGRQRWEWENSAQELGWKGCGEVNERTGFRFLASAGSKLSARTVSMERTCTHAQTQTIVYWKITHTRNTKPDEWSAPNYGIKLNWFWYPTISFTDSFPLCEQPLNSVI